MGLGSQLFLVHNGAMMAMQAFDRWIKEDDLKTRLSHAAEVDRWIREAESDLKASKMAWKEYKKNWG